VRAKSSESDLSSEKGLQEQAAEDRGVGSLQLRVLRFGLLQNGDVRVGIFPEREEVFVGGERPDAGGI
jgi:hypothetical protein